MSSPPSLLLHSFYHFLPSFGLQSSSRNWIFSFGETSSPTFFFATGLHSIIYIGCLLCGRGAFSSLACKFRHVNRAYVQLIRIPCCLTWFILALSLNPSIQSPHRSP
ncbi:hypothetical protein C8R44DRAFT_241142 [Mycena epipterygia]|nr:hypothetical protein C8R44DRAFT_241142 [Mycena epipterygia]